MRARTGFLIGVAVGLQALPFVWRPKPATVTIAAAVREVPAGATLSLDDVTLREVPVELATMSLVWPADLPEQLGRPLKFALHTGDLVRHADFAMRPPALQAGERAMTLELEEKRALNGGLGHGDRVDVLATLKDEAGDLAVKTIVGDLKVNEVIHRAPPALTSVMLSGPAEAIEALMLANEVSKPWLTLRADGDGAQVDAPEQLLTVRTLLNGRKGHGHAGCALPMLKVAR